MLGFPEYSAVLRLAYNKALLSQPLAAGTAHFVARPKARR